MSDQTIIINGTTYDKHTGAVIAKSSRPLTSRNSAHAKNIHASTQKSKTLSRRYVHKTVEPLAAKPQSAKVDQPQSETVKVHNRSTATLPKIQKFAKPVVKKPTSTRVMDVAPTVHPMVQRVHAASKQPQAQRIPKPSSILKAEAIQKALDEAKPVNKRQRMKVQKTKTQQRKLHFARVATACAIMLLVGGYFTYINMPNVSVRVAAAQAGINATYPSYRPSGYSLSGPVAYNDGQVSMKFAANGSSQGYTLSQTSSGLDSTAVLERFVKPTVGQDYTISRSSGLTIYTFRGNAAWVNGGILYTIEGDAPLTNDQIQHIALSM